MTNFRRPCSVLVSTLQKEEPNMVKINKNIRKIEKKLESFSKLKVNWNDNGAMPIDNSIVNAECSLQRKGRNLCTYL